MSTKKITFIFIVLALSVFVNVFLSKELLSLYKRFSSFSIDPSGKIYKKIDYSGGIVASKNISKRTVVYFGDSRVAQWKNVFKKPHIRVINSGQSGDTSAIALLRIFDDVLVYNPDTVVIQIGINDLKVIGLMPNEKKLILANYKKNLNKILSLLTAKEVNVILLTILSPGDIDLLRKFIWSNDIDVSIEEINNYILNLEYENLTALNCDELLSVNGRMSRKYQVDSLHINKTGYEVLNDCLNPYLNK